MAGSTRKIAWAPAGSGCVSDISDIKAAIRARAATMAPDLVAALIQDAAPRGEDFFRQLINALPAAVYTTDADGRITYFNEAAAELWGCRPSSARASGAARGSCSGRMAGRCPMTNARWRIALKEKRPMRGMEAIAERPGRHARAVHAVSDAALRCRRHADRRGEHAGRYDRPQARRAGRCSIWQRSSNPPTTPSSARTSTASSPAGTKARSGCSAIWPKR